MKKALNDFHSHITRVKISFTCCVQVQPAVKTHEKCQHQVELVFMLKSIHRDPVITGIMNRMLLNGGKLVEIKSVFVFGVTMALFC